MKPKLEGKDFHSIFCACHPLYVLCGVLLIILPSGFLTKILYVFLIALCMLYVLSIFYDMIIIVMCRGGMHDKNDGF
jgi:hypothetical protein